MNYLVSAIDPKKIIRSVSIAQQNYLVDQFIEVIDKVYQYEIFKPMLDMVATKAYEKKLKFKITHQELFHLDEGNCCTVEGGTFNKILNRFVSTKEYTITIRKISSDVVIHEIGHMIEKEADLVLSPGFNSAITMDIKAETWGNRSLGSAIQTILIKEVRNYPVDQIASEMFTRYFQLLAMSREVAGRGAEYGYTLNEVYKAFPNTEKWIVDNLYYKLGPRYNPQIVQASKQYIKQLEDIEHKWSEEKVKSFHNDKGEKAWGKTIKSIKD